MLCKALHSIHCIISGGGLSYAGNLVKNKGKFFIPVGVLRDKFKGKYLSCLSKLHNEGKPAYSNSCQKLQNAYHWKEFKAGLYARDWCPFIKETFNGFENAIEYLGKYTHKIAISNAQIQTVTDTMVTFFCKRQKTRRCSKDNYFESP